MTPQARRMIRLVCAAVLGVVTNTACGIGKTCDEGLLQTGAAKLAEVSPIEQPSVAAFAIVKACGRPPTSHMRDHLSRKAEPLASFVSQSAFEDPIHEELWKEVCPGGPNYSDMYSEKGVRNLAMYRICEHARLGILTADEEAIATTGPAPWLIFAWMRREGAEAKVARKLTRALLLPGASTEYLEVPEGQALPQVNSAGALPAAIELRVDGEDTYVDGARTQARPGKTWNQRWLWAFADHNLGRENSIPHHAGEAVRLVADASLPGEALLELLSTANDWKLGPVYVVVQTPRPYRPFAGVPMRRAVGAAEPDTLRFVENESLGEFTARAARRMGQPCCVDAQGPGCPSLCAMSEVLVAFDDPESTKTGMETLIEDLKSGGLRTESPPPE